MPRRFVTVEDVDRLVDEGVTELRFDAGTTITDLARERARERGLAVIRTEQAGGVTPLAGQPAVTSERGRVRAEVRAAVIAQLGSEPLQLERIIDRVLDGQG